MTGKSLIPGNGFIRQGSNFFAAIGGIAYELRIANLQREREWKLNAGDTDCQYDLSARIAKMMPDE